MDFFVGTIEWVEGDTSFLTNIWARGSHVGEAIQRILSAAKLNEIESPVLIDLEGCEVDDIIEGAVAVDRGNSFIDPREYSFPTQYSYKFPYGVIPVRNAEHSIDVDAIRPGYETWRDDDGLINVEAVIEREEIFDFYVSLVETLPEIRTFWLKLQEDWEEFGSEEIYACDELTTSLEIRDFLRDNWIDTVLNGHVALTTYTDEGHTNLSISDHKMVVLLTYDERIAKTVCASLKHSGLNRHEDMLSVAGGVHHWHYRHADGRDRQGLIRLLCDKGFKLWVP